MECLQKSGIVNEKTSKICREATIEYMHKRMREKINDNNNKNNNN